MMNLLKKLAACGLSLTMMTPPPAKAAVSPSSI